jgi:hypothetical protein
MLPAPSCHFHAVRFYKDSVHLSRIVADFLMDGFAQNQPALVIATPPHRELIIDELGQGGFDIEQMKAAQRLILVDAETTLEEFMKDGMPQADTFRRCIIPYIQQACGDRADCVIRAYGEMVDLLWRQDQTSAAIRLEMLWNDLARTQDFSLLCGYSMGSFYKDADVDGIYTQHTHVVGDSGEPRLVA